MNGKTVFAEGYAALYDAVYGTKDYQAEVARVTLNGSYCRCERGTMECS